MVVGDEFLVISVSGATNGGKTSLIQKLLKEFPQAKVIRQDDFFIPEDDPRHKWLQTETFRHQNWELESAIDFDQLKMEVRSQTSSGTDLIYRIVFIEGHVLFADSEISAWSDKKYFLTLTEEQCKERRCKRSYQPPDPPGYFELCIYPEYLRHLSFVRTNVNYVDYLDGSDSQETIFNRVLTDVRQLLRSQKI